MMVKTFFGLLLVMSAVQAADTPVDNSALLQELDKIEAQRKAQMTNGLSAIIDQLNAALGSPKDAIELYEKAVFANQFEGGSRDESEFSKWKTQMGEKMKNPVFQLALQYHIEYLIFTLKRIGGVESKALANDLNSYVQKYREDEDKLSTESKSKDSLVGGLLQRPVSEGPFSKYFQIEKQFDNLTDWQLEAGNTKAIEDTIIFPTLRNLKDSGLMALWDQRINYERDRSQRSGLSEDKSVFENNRFPNMLWGKAKDQILLGDQPGGIKSMMAVIHTYPLNASFDSWVKELREILSPKPTATADDTAAPASSTTPTPAPATTANPTN